MTDFETHPIGTAKRIEGLEAKLEALDIAYDSIVQALQFEGLRTDEAESKLAKAVRALQFIACERNEEGRHAIFILAKLKGETNGTEQ